jgi:hypothetical protein
MPISRPAGVSKEAMGAGSEQADVPGGSGPAVRSEPSQTQRVKGGMSAMAKKAAKGGKKKGGKKR